ALPVVVNHFGMRAEQPLQHTTLLPGPGAGRAEVSPPVAVFEIDNADADLFVRLRRSILKSDFHTEHVAAGGVEFQLVVIAEPMKLRTMCECAHGPFFAPKSERRRGQRFEEASSICHGSPNSLFKNRSAQAKAQCRLRGNKT